MEEEDFGKLPLETRWSHKQWKARQNGYDEAIKIFKSALGPEDPCLLPFKDGVMLKQAATDANVVSLESGLKAVIGYAEIADLRDVERLRGLALRDLCEKGLGAMKPATKTAALEALLAFVGASEQPVQCVDLLIPLLGDKRPKMVLAATNALVVVYSEYGGKAVDPTPVLKALPKLFESADAKVRAEAAKLAVTLSWYVTPAVVEQVLSPSIKPIALKDVKNKMDASSKVDASRVLRVHSGAGDAGDVAAEPMEYEVDAEAGGIDPWTLAEPKQVLDKLPAGFEAAQASPKFLERVEPLKALAALLDAPRLAPGDYSSLVQFLIGRLNKEKHFQCQDQLVSCVRLLVVGLRTAFPGARGELVPVLLERLKEKKVVENVHNTLQAIFVYWPLQDYWDAAQAAMENKTPLVRVEATRVAVKFFQETATMPPAPFAAQVAAAAAKSVADTNEQVRAQGIVLLATLAKMFGPRVTQAAMDGLDDLKRRKVDEATSAVTYVASASKAAASKQPAAPKVASRARPAGAPAAPAAGPGAGAKPAVRARPAAGGAPGTRMGAPPTRLAPPSRPAAPGAPGGSRATSPPSRARAGASGTGAGAAPRAGSPRRLSETPVKTKNARTSQAMQWTPARDPTPARRRMDSPLRSRMPPPPAEDEMHDLAFSSSSSAASISANGGLAGSAGEPGTPESHLVDEMQLLRTRLEAEISRRGAAETRAADAQQLAADLQQQLAESQQQLAAARRRAERAEQLARQAPELDSVNRGMTRMSLDPPADDNATHTAPADKRRSMIQLGVPRTPGSRPAGSPRASTTAAPKEDSWTRAAEVSNELRKRIEAMKRQRGAV